MPDEFSEKVRFSRELFPNGDTSVERFCFFLGGGPKKTNNNTPGGVLDYNSVLVGLYLIKIYSYTTRTRTNHIDATNPLLFSFFLPSRIRSILIPKIIKFYIIIISVYLHPLRRELLLFIIIKCCFLKYTTGARFFLTLGERFYREASSYPK